MNGGEHCTQKDRWLSSRPSHSSLGVQALPPQKAFLSAKLLPPWVAHRPLCLTWALRKGVSCGLAENVVLRLQLPCPIPLGDVCQGCPVLA